MYRFSRVLRVFYTSFHMHFSVTVLPEIVSYCSEGLTFYCHEISKLSLEQFKSPLQIMLLLPVTGLENVLGDYIQCM